MPPARRTGRAKGSGARKARPRRSAADARQAILAAAERRLVRGGPEALRLLDIAGDVGVSHPAILHHFGSRAGLVAALVQHAMEGLQRSLLAIVASRPADRPFEVRVERAARMLEETHAVLHERGYARLLAWLVLSGGDVRPLAGELFAEFAQAIHESRAERRAAEGREPPPVEQTLFGAAMTMITLFGDALFGDVARRAVGLAGDPDEARRFRRWMAEVIERA